jgi:hypothetical protein
MHRRSGAFSGVVVGITGVEKVGNARRLALVSRIPGPHPGDPFRHAEARTGKPGRVLIFLALQDVASLLATAEPKFKTEVYAELGVSVAYDHERQVVTVEARPKGARANGRVGEGT